MAFSADIVMQMTANETLSGAGTSSTVNVPQDALNSRSSLNSGTTPPATKSSYFTQALTAGSATIDLTSLTNIAGTAGAVTFSGLKVQAMLIYAPASNTGSITLTKGASNGYGLTAGGGTWTLPVSPGARFLLTFDDELPDVSGSVKTIDLSGTGTESVTIGLIAG